MMTHFTSHDLRIAILTNQLAITLQPKVCLKKFDVIGHEVLLRWNHPTFGLIPANQWIEIAEERNLITPLTLWLTEQVARLLSQRQSNLPVAINVSPASMTPAFANQIITTLRRYNVLPSLITLELTESKKIDNYNVIAGSLSILRREGIRISLDDFGTGYNSMRTLVELEVDEIKIDKTMMQSDHPNTTLILNAIASLAKEINLTIVCEGIENNTHFNRALKINAEIGQGFLFGKPEPIDQIIQHANTSRESA